MIDKLLSSIAPYLCLGCQKTGTILCDHCKGYIINKPFRRCIFCAKPSRQTICSQHHPPFSQAFIVGERTGELQALTDALKFKNVRVAADPMAALLAPLLQGLDKQTVIIPIPTARHRIRYRGYDHTDLLATALAQRTGMQIRRALVRHGKSEQKTVGRTERRVQASAAYTIDIRLDAATNYLLLDDIVTTGATLCAAATLLRAAGAKHIDVAAVAWQPLD